MRSFSKFGRWLVPLVVCSAASLAPSEIFARAFGARELVEYTSYGEWVGGAEPYTVSPNGHWVAVLAHHGDLKRDAQIYTIIAYRSTAIQLALKSGRRPRPVIKLALRSYTNDPAITAIRWSDASHIAFLCVDNNSSDQPKAEGVYQICRIDVATGRLTKLTHEQFGVSSFEIVGSRILYAATASLKPRDPPLTYPSRPLGADYFLARMGANLVGSKQLSWKDESGPEHRIGVELAANDPSFWCYWLAPGGRHAIINGTARQLSGKETAELGRTTQTSDWVFAVVDLDSGVIRPLRDSPRLWIPPGPHSIIFESGGQKALIATPELGQGQLTWIVREYNLATGDYRTIGSGPSIKADDASVTPFVANPHGSVSIVERGPGLILVTYRAAGSITEVGYQRTSEGWHAIAPFPMQSNLVTARGLKIDVSQSADKPPLLLASNGVREVRLTEPDPVLAGVAIAPMKTVKWKDASGREWTAGLILPPESNEHERVPLVIQLYHPPDPKVFDPGGAAPVATYAAQALASRGMAVLLFDGTPTNVSQRDEPVQVERGIEAAVAKLEKDGMIDRERIGLIGHSHYAWEIDWILTHPSTIHFDAVVSNEGPGAGSYFEYLMFFLSAVDSNAAPIIARQYESLYGSGTFWDNKDAWLKGAPGFNYDRMRAPILITESGGERDNPMLMAEMYASLRDLQRPVDLVDFPFGAHVLGRPRQRLASFQLTIDWMAYWLMADVDPDPAKREQYARWEKLCDLWRSENPTRPTSCIPTRH